jgi:hypothetical protein
VPGGQCRVDLYWLPLGAGGRSVRFNGRVYEALVAWRRRRERLDLYHSALEVTTPEGAYVIEMAPIPNDGGAARGVVAEGAVGSSFAGSLRLFRYEVRRWRGGRIPDVAEAVDSPRCLSTDGTVAKKILALVPQVPTHVWGRDALNVNDMWNSNSLISWLLVSAGLDILTVTLPPGGRAPGWTAGIAAAEGTLRAQADPLAATGALR